MHGVDRAVGSSRRESGPGRRGGDAKAALLALHVAARLAIGHLDVDRAAICQLRRTHMLVNGDDAGKDHEQDKHRREDGLALPGILDTDAEGEAAGDRNQQQAGHLDDVGEGIGVLIRMRRVRAKEAAAVGAGLFDGNLAGRRTLGQKLLGDHAGALDDLAVDLDRVALDLGAVDDAPTAVCIRLDSNGLYELSLLSRLKIGDNATGSQADAEHEVQRDEHIQDGAGEVDPEGTQTLLLDLTETADEREHDRNTGAGGQEVLHGEAHELHKVGQGGLTGIGLPVGVGYEGSSSIERQVP